MDATAKKTALRMIPYGLYVLTAANKKGEIAAATVNWVTQASFEPPLVMMGMKTDNDSHRLIEENTWRAIRYGLSGELIDFASGDVVPARARIEQLIEWVEPVAAEIGAAQFLAVPAANAAERQYARLEELPTHRAVFAELVRVPERVA